MKLYTQASPSHELLTRRFLLPSARDYDEIHVVQSHQSGNGNFHNPEWYDAMRVKSGAMYTAASESRGEVFVWADADVVFLEPTAEWFEYHLGDAEFAAMQGPTDRDFNAGLWVARATDNLIEWLRSTSEVDDDQGFMNENRDMVDWKILPTPDVFDLTHLPRDLKQRFGSGEEHWFELLQTYLPLGVRAYHASGIVGLDQKYQALDLVSWLYAGNRFPRILCQTNS